jgi:hypothetical protein
VIQFASRNQYEFNMPFQKGHKLAKGGARKGAGRKSNQTKANEAEAIRIFREELAAHFQEFFALMKKLCKGFGPDKFSSVSVISQLGGGVSGEVRIFLCTSEVLNYNSA